MPKQNAPGPKRGRCSSRAPGRAADGADGQVLGAPEKSGGHHAAQILLHRGWALSHRCRHHRLVRYPLRRPRLFCRLHLRDSVRVHGAGGRTARQGATGKRSVPPHRRLHEVHDPAARQGALLHGRRPVGALHCANGLFGLGTQQHRGALPRDHRLQPHVRAPQLRRPLLRRYATPPCIPKQRFLGTSALPFFMERPQELTAQLVPRLPWQV
eukprot:scaffold14199_cov118-Isochrysis_galbana.AAC.2